MGIAVSLVGSRALSGLLYPASRLAILCRSPIPLAVLAILTVAWVAPARRAAANIPRQRYGTDPGSGLRFISTDETLREIVPRVRDGERAISCRGHLDQVCGTRVAPASTTRPPCRPPTPGGCRGRTGQFLAAADPPGCTSPGAHEGGPAPTQARSVHAPRVPAGARCGHLTQCPRHLRRARPRTTASGLEKSRPSTIWPATTATANRLHQAPDHQVRGPRTAASGRGRGRYAACPVVLEAARINSPGDISGDAPDMAFPSNC